MNCKPGDLAITVKSFAGNEGKICTVLKWIGEVPGYCGRDWWETDVYFKTILGDLVKMTRDSFVRPIRPDSYEDETLQWAPIPGQKLKEPA